MDQLTLPLITIPSTFTRRDAEARTSLWLSEKLTLAEMSASVTLYLTPAILTLAETLPLRVALAETDPP
ncbi:MAG: hypothetical protein ACKON9_07535 [Planctomycetaceae bacterium]